MPTTGHAPRSVLIVLCLLASGCDRKEALLNGELKRVERAAQRGDLVEVAQRFGSLGTEARLVKHRDTEVSRIVAENYDALTASVLDGGTLRTGTGSGSEIVFTTETTASITHLMGAVSAQRPEVAARWPALEAALKSAHDRDAAERDGKKVDEAAKHDDEVRNRVLFVTREVEFRAERRSCLERLRLDVPPNWLQVHDAPSTHDQELAAAVVTLYEKPRLTTETVKVDSTTGAGRGARALRGLKALTGADRVEVGTITAMDLEVTVTAPNAKKRSAKWEVVLPEAQQPSFHANDPEDQSRALTELWQGQCERLTAGVKLAPAK